MRKTIIPSALLTLLLFSCAEEKIVEESGANTSFSKADIITEDIPMHASIVTKDGTPERDYFRFENKTAAVFKIELVTDTKANLYFVVYDSAFHVLKGVNNYGFEDEYIEGGEFLANIYLEKGVYFIVVYAAKDNENDGDYTLYLERTKDKKNVEHEPNDTLAAADTLPLNGYINGYFSPRNNMFNREGKAAYMSPRYVEFDVYEIEHDDSIAGDICVEIEINAVPDIDSVLRVYDESGTLLFEINNESEGAAELIENLILPRYDTRYIGVYAKNSRANGQFNYRIAARPRALDDAHEYEPNNIESQAKEIVLDSQYFGKINYAGDTDVFVLECDETNECSFVLNVADDIHISALITTITGSAVFNATSGTENFSGRSESLQFDKGRYYLYLTGYVERGGKKYNGVSEDYYQFELSSLR